MVLEPDSEHEGFHLLRDPKKTELRDMQRNTVWQIVLKAKGFVQYSLICGLHPNCEDGKGVDPALIEDEQLRKHDYPLMYAVLPATDDIETDELIERFNDDHWFNLAFHMEPPLPGARLFMTKMRFDNFRPGVEGDDQYHFQWYLWAGLQWGIMSIPYDQRHIAYRAAEETEVQITNESPVAMDGQEKKTFPLSRVFMLKHPPGSRFQCDDDEVGSYRWARDDEDREVEAIHAEYERWLRHNRDALATLDPVARDDKDDDDE